MGWSKGTRKGIELSIKLLDEAIALLKTREFENDFDSGRNYCPWCGAWGEWDLGNPKHKRNCKYVKLMKNYASFIKS